MARIVGINIPDNKQVATALTSIFGIGPSLSKKILGEAKIDGTKKTSQLKPEDLNIIRDIIEKNYRIEGGLKRDIMGNIRRLRDIGSWRGARHSKRLPLHGQRTRTNSRTVRGNVRKTVSSGRKKASSPT
jgi:small subunit ribosomal protein S13